MKVFNLCLIVLLMAGLTSGCIAPPSVQEAQQDVKAAETALCTSVKAYAASVEALEQVTAETTVAEYEALKAAQVTTKEAMIAAWEDLNEAEKQTVESAFAELESALTDVSPEQTLGEVALGIKTSAATVKAAVDQLTQKACVPAQ